jgi:hypothetical protein
MKKSIFILLLFALLSCSKSDDTGTDTKSGTSYISMKINGVAWKGEVNFFSALNSGVYFGGAKIDNNTKTQSIAFAFETISLSGTNSIVKTSKGGITYVDQNTGVSWAAGESSNGTGTLTVTKSKVITALTHVTATFTISTKDSNGNAVSVTDGVIYNALAN